MTKRILIAALFIILTFFVSAQTKPISDGFRISKTTNFKRAVYKIDAPADTSKTIILIEGNNIVIDFNNAELSGSNGLKNPDEFFGVAILIRNSKNVTIRNLKVRGFKVAVMARNTDNLILENCDFSYNYRQHLNSSQEKEDVSDWMSYHHNEKDEWLRYGAAMYLRNCNFVTVRNCKVTGGQNALMMVECNDGLIVNNNFSFNSGIGIGMYRSSRNRVIYNKAIFNVRGYSHGVYNRGQDSAGFLVYEQSSNNLFFKNIVTHSGDGFFLWAGQTTMDTGEGGCNDNLLWENDFSYAPTNGIEATFSRNAFIGNILNECDHGIWGGYSYNSTFSNNKLVGNRIGMAIEHGQENIINLNEFKNNKEAIRLWARKTQPADWGYAQKRDTRSKNYRIFSNLMEGNETSFNFSLSDSMEVGGNNVKRTKTLLKRDSSLTNFQFNNNDSLTTVILKVGKRKWPDSIVKAGKEIKIPDSTYAGKKNIRINEWGPYDFRSPVIWNNNPTDTSAIMKFDLIGPKGKWKIKNVRGVKNISAVEGRFPASITAEKVKAERTDVFIEIEYTGNVITSPFGENIPAGKPYYFSFKKFFQPIDWDVLFYSLDTISHNPIKSGMLFSLYQKKAPFKTEKINKLDYAWWGGIKAGDVQHKQFITVADGMSNIPKGMYELSVTWDDAVRVYIDDKLVIDEWNPSLYKFDESPNKRIKLSLSGDHHFRVEHLELGGFAALSLKIRPVE